MSTPIRVLQLEDSLSDAMLVLELMREGGFDCEAERVDTEAAFVAALARPWDVILSDYKLPQFSGLRALDLVKERGLATPVIIISGVLGDEMSAASKRHGAADFISRDRMARLPEAVKTALETRGLEASRRTAESEAQVAQAASAGLTELVRRDQVMAEIGRIVSSSLNIEEVYPKFAEQAAKLVPFDRIVIVLLDPSRNAQTMAFVSGTPVPDFAAGREMDLHGSVQAKLVGSGRSIVMDGDEVRRLAPTDESFRQGLSVGLKSLLFIPLVSQSSIIGSLNFRSKLENPYTPEVVALAEQVAGQITGAFNLAGLYAQSKRDVEARTVIAEIGRIVSSSLDIGEVYPKFAELAAQIIPFDRVVITSLDEDGRGVTVAFVSRMQLPEFPAGQKFAVAGTPHEQVLLSRRASCLAVVRRGVWRRRTNPGGRCWMRACGPRCSFRLSGRAESPVCSASGRSWRTSTPRRWSRSQSRWPPR